VGLVARLTRAPRACYLRLSPAGIRFRWILSSTISIDICYSSTYSSRKSGGKAAWAAPSSNAFSPYENILRCCTHACCISSSRSNPSCYIVFPPVAALFNMYSTVLSKRWAQEQATCCAVLRVHCYDRAVVASGGCLANGKLGIAGSARQKHALNVRTVDVGRMVGATACGTWTTLNDC